MDKTQPPEPSAFSRWWKSPPVRKVRKRVSNLQVLLYPLASGFLCFYARLIQKVVQYDRRGPMYDYIRQGKPFVLTFWHEDNLPGIAEFLRFTNEFPTVAMISPGRLGSAMKRLHDHFGLRTVYGSNSKDGIKAVQEMTHVVNAERISAYVSADGSRGPSRVAAWGAIYLARDTGLPIIACRAWAENQIIFKRTWMKLAWPLPWGRAICLTSEPMFIPKEATKEELTGYRARLEEVMNEQADASVAYFEQGPEAVAAWSEADFTP